MKTLLLMRHASSGWDELSLADRARPLDEKGEHELSRLTRRYAAKGVRPQLIVSSPALRALSTARALATTFGLDADAVHVDERLYCGSARAMLDSLGEFDDTLDCVAVVGHNPEITELAHHLARDIDFLPTCAIATMGFEATHWSELRRCHAAVAMLDTPP
ncbi:MAG: histidine phosphatase family protein [Piscinibacter sp.]